MTQTKLIDASFNHDLTTPTKSSIVPNYSFVTSNSSFILFLFIQSSLGYLSAIRSNPMVLSSTTNFALTLDSLQFYTQIDLGHTTNWINPELHYMYRPTYMWVRCSNVLPSLFRYGSDCSAVLQIGPITQHFVEVHFGLCLIVFLVVVGGREALIVLGVLFSNRTYTSLLWPQPSTSTLLAKSDGEACDWTLGHAWTSLFTNRHKHDAPALEMAMGQVQVEFTQTQTKSV